MSRNLTRPFTKLRLPFRAHIFRAARPKSPGVAVIPPASRRGDDAGIIKKIYRLHRRRFRGNRDVSLGDLNLHRTFWQTRLNASRAPKRGPRRDAPRVDHRRKYHGPTLRPVLKFSTILFERSTGVTRTCRRSGTPSEQRELNFATLLRTERESRLANWTTTSTCTRPHFQKKNMREKKKEGRCIRRP